MFARKKMPVTYDITQKVVKTWWGGKKFVPTSYSEQKKIKKEILKRDPSAIVIDSNTKQNHELDWIDCIEEFDALI